MKVELRAAYLLESGSGRSGKGGTLAGTGGGCTKAAAAAATTCELGGGGGVASILGCLEGVAAPEDADADASRRLRVPPLNMALTSSHAWTTSSGGAPLRRRWRRHELKLAASGCTYLAVGPERCEWKMNLLGEKKRPQRAHFMHLALEELYLQQCLTVLGTANHPQ